MTNKNAGVLFSVDLMRQIKDRFHYVDFDMRGRRRLFFDNAGGSFRLKTATERHSIIDAIPDCPERIHELALYLQDVQERGTQDVRTVLNALNGTVYASLTASGAMFDMVRAITENIPGKNMVTSVLEHPSSYDAMEMYATRTGKELRVAKSNTMTGGIDVDDVVGLVDENTCLLSVMYASNISGAKIDIEKVVSRARAIKPDLYILVDAVQHAPHGIIDLQKTAVDGINFAPYKFFGCRGSGFSWLSPRAARLPHNKLAGKAQDFWDLGSPTPSQFAVVTEMVDYVCWLGSQFSGASERRALFACGMDRIAQHEQALLFQMLNGGNGVPGLRKIDGLKVFFDHDDLTTRDLIVAITFDGLTDTQAVREYEKRGVIVYERVTTSLYSQRMLDSFGIKGSVRVSPLHCNSTEDISQFLEITRELSLL
ncbi:aminotransferase class V-fold PLP-dependent enzyme [uncultured Caballeronia sp.]|uniref:aminotransferase class V-fold PLP-dependent enzyme n=1 Tax=uncultured Caballeronia sp. TaxID=1827198 RepID=UPI0035CA3378